jgi:hypothetical protein
LNLDRSNGENGDKNTLIVPTKFFVTEAACDLLPVQDYMVANPQDIRQVIFKYAAGNNVCEYELGCMLLRVKEEDLWKRREFSRNSQEPYASFGNWIYGEMGISYRKGRHLILLARKLLDMKADPAFIRKLIILGWTKAYQVLRVAETTQEVNEWYKVAQKCGERELRDKATVALHGKNGTSGPRVITTKSDSVPQPEFAPIEFSCSFGAKEDYEFVARARAIIAKRYGEEMTNDRFISLLAANYISTKLPGQGEEIIVELDEKIKSIEEEYGVRLAPIISAESRVGGIPSGPVPNTGQVFEGKAGSAV